MPCFLFRPPLSWQVMGMHGAALVHGFFMRRWVGGAVAEWVVWVVWWVDG